MRTQGSADKLEYRRRLAVERVSEGYSTQEVADFLGVDCSSVRRWLAAFRDRGDAGLVVRPVSGRPCKLATTQEKIALRWLTQSPTHHGFDTELWTAARLGQLIREEFGVGLNPRSLSSWLRDRGFTPQKPPPVARERDPKAIAAWLESDWPRIKKKARRQRAHMTLIDESGLLMAPRARRTWSFRGQTPDREQKSGTRENVSVAAAVWLSPRRDRWGLYSHTLANGYFDRWYLAAFWEAMRKDLAGRLVVVWDGGPMHKGDPIPALKSHFGSRLDLERLPPYAPMLNPVESLWSWLNWERLSNLAPKDATELDARVIAELGKVHEDQAFLRNLFHASDLPLPRALLS
jgi:transposase